MNDAAEPPTLEQQTAEFEEFRDIVLGAEERFVEYLKRDTWTREDVDKGATWVYALLEAADKMADDLAALEKRWQGERGISYEGYAMLDVMQFVYRVEAEQKQWDVKFHMVTGETPDHPWEETGD